jgi:prolyl-tRNA synthetase
MAHGDDNGLRVPPRIASWQIVIIPIQRNDGDKEAVHTYCQSLRQALQMQSYGGERLRVKLDARDISGSDKKWDWVKKGAPLIIEVGPRDVEGGKVCVSRRDQLDQGKAFVLREEFLSGVVATLTSIQKNLFEQASAFMKARTITTVKTRAEFDTYFSKKSEDNYAEAPGFVRAKWSGDKSSLPALDELGVSVRCIPFDQDGKNEPCVLTGAPATQDVIFARAY